MRRVLVTGAGGSAGMNFVKSLRLADEDYFVVGTDTNRFHLELADVDARYTVPRASDPGYFDALNRLIEAHDIDLVHPQPDTEVGVLASNREKVNARTLLPRAETVALCHDKQRFAVAMRAAGVPVPESRLIGSPDDLAEAVSSLRARHEKIWLRATRGAGSRAALPVRTVEEGAMWIKYWERHAKIGYGDFMASEFLPGAEYAFQSLWWKGELVTSAARERLEYVFGNLTPSGQSSSPSVARSVNRDDVNDVASRAVKAADPDATGVFCVDLKRNVDGVACVMEINCGRFFTTSNFFAEAGANMPDSYVTMALEDAPPKGLPRVDAVPEGWYWVRLIDGGHRLVKGEAWRSRDA